MTLTELQGATIASVVRDLAIRTPHARGDVIGASIAATISGASIWQADRPRIAAMLAANACRAWLHNVETASRRGESYAASVAYADDFATLYRFRSF